METPAITQITKIKRWLPYWAVFQSDLRQTLHSWVYRVWVLALVLATTGFLLYRSSIEHEALMIQWASKHVSDLLRWTVLGSIALIIALTGGSISGERGTMADSVLSRGISRYQYFMGKWHARLVVVLGTVLFLGLGAMAGGYFLLHDDLKVMGGIVAMTLILALLATVTTAGVTVSAMANNTMLGITVLWFLVFGIGYGLSFLPTEYLSPERELAKLPEMLRGEYDWKLLKRLLSYSGLASVFLAMIGMGYFARRDV